MIRRTTLSHTALALSFVLANGCALEKTDDEVDAYRQALPEAEHVRVAGPEADARSGARLTAADAAPAPAPAHWYLFTRQVRDDVNHVTAGVLGSVWRLAHTAPTTLEPDAAVWGPYSDALEPVIWRFRIERVAEHAYEYALEGRAKLDGAASVFTPVLTGTGYDRLDERHGDGAFTIDLEAAKRLDPAKHRDDSGSLTVTHDLPRSIWREAAPLPRTIRAEAQAAGEDWFDVTSIANEDGTGELVVDAHGDIDESKLTLAEDVHVDSRWQLDGAGRADITITGGDLPSALPAVNATECWGQDFSRAYYVDSADLAPSEGEASACAFDALAP